MSALLAMPLISLPSVPLRRSRGVKVRVSSWGLVRAIWGAVALSLAAMTGAMLHHGPSMADGVVNNSRAAGALPVKSDPFAAWHQLSAPQQQVLLPLREHWGELDDISRDKWLGVAERYPKLGPAEQARVRERMGQWARTTPTERGEARLRFQQSRQLSPDERQKKWEAYQSLPKADRDDLQRQAVRRAKPVYLPDKMVGPREAQQAFAVKRNTAAVQTDRKTNMVPTPNGSANSAAVVAPTVVKAGPGATTNLVTQRPMPPLHQQSGLPKIAATKGFVDPVTLLPQRGAQSAGMSSPNAGNPAPDGNVNR
jgi:hypothetical protein